MSSLDPRAEVVGVRRIDAAENGNLPFECWSEVDGERVGSVVQCADLMAVGREMALVGLVTASGKLVPNCLRDREDGTAVVVVVPAG
ncbi:hypothetical protein [Brevibacterium album]|uniref:hypothetical protein n=1 Tax=Brevibacterium album TaxID=417948 RepID=UPI0012EBF328|nr:hypothetical protein [Brevibacterium album]